MRITVGEKNLKEEMVEIKERTGKENQPVKVEDIISFLKK
jgi:threonyl-tRNA synthetase